MQQWLPAATHECCAQPVAWFCPHVHILVPCPSAEWPCSTPCTCKVTRDCKVHVASYILKSYRSKATRPVQQAVRLVAVRGAIDHRHPRPHAVWKDEEVVDVAQVIARVREVREAHPLLHRLVAGAAGGAVARPRRVVEPACFRNGKLHVTRYTLHVTSYKLQVTSYKLQAASTPDCCNSPARMAGGGAS